MKNKKLYTHPIYFLVLFISSFTLLCNKNPTLHSNKTCESLELTPGQWQFLGLADQGITTIAVDPSDPCIIYIGSSNFGEDMSGRGAIFKSSDGGMTWTTLVDQIMVGDIAIDPQSPNTVYATAAVGVLKTADGGRRWRFVNQGIRLDWEWPVPIAIHPQNTNILFLGTSAAGGAGSFYKSVNGGESWRRILKDHVGSGPTAIAFDQNNPNTIYMGESGVCRLWKTEDGGINWHVTGFKEGGLIKDIRIDPLNSNTVYCIVGRKGLFISRNKGETWKPFGNAIDSTRIAQRTFVINPYHSDEMFIGTGIYGVFRSLDRGMTWNQINEGLENLWVQELAIGGNGEILYAGFEGGVYGRHIHMIID